MPWRRERVAHGSFSRAGLVGLVDSAAQGFENFRSLTFGAGKTRYKVRGKSTAASREGERGSEASGVFESKQ
jgi:hypothetical protein